MSKAEQKQTTNFWQNLSISSLEADIAYFEARVEMVGKPETFHQQAQLKAYQALERAMRETLARLRGEKS
ncbi:MAG: hypothetical protein L3J28_01490 [Candidatus Polarisedimenticolaceae bacterium]|nr:hypothetical protein [Candidatus Polarisedimenticolaceae bacterium]